MNIYSASVLCFSFGVTLIAILALMKRRDRIAYRFFIFSISICGWGYLFPVWISQQHSADNALIIAKISYIFVVFIPATWLHFLFEFIEKKEPFKFFYAVNYAISLTFAAFCPTRLMIAGMEPFLSFKYLPVAGSVQHFHVLHFVALVSIGLFFLIRKYFTVKGYEKDRLRYFVWGAVIGFASGGAVYITYYRIPLEMHHLVLLPLYPILTGVALIRYGLFDVNQIADAFQREKLAALGTMAASLNHEIRNPLFIARGKSENYFDAVERGIHSDSEKKLNACETALKESHSQLMRALDTMQRFSDFARPFKTKADSEKVLVRDAVANVLKFVSNEFALHKIQLDQSALNGVSVTVNRRQFEEILFNVILNACHAMGDKGGSLRISSQAIGKRISVEIKDSGPGMSEEQLQRIFEPFYTTKQEMGTGLGLYITKQLVERNGGRISVHSSAGKGTKFMLEFKA